MSEKKLIKHEDLKNVAGGVSTRLADLKEELLKDIPAQLKDKLALAHSDVEVCKLLAEGGVDVEKIEKRIKEAGFDLNKIGLQIPDSELSEITGGFASDDYDLDVACICGNNNRDDFSYQFFVSVFKSDYDWYRCKKCNMYMGITSRNTKIFTYEGDFKNKYGL